MEQLPKRFVFMKVGNHAGETWDEILERKSRELARAGRVFWGYGGAACHPIQQVQPFARMAIKDVGRICLVMEPITSNADPELLPAHEYSEDGVTWSPIPEGIEVTGSRYALVLDEIRAGELMLPVTEFEVGVGPSRGKPLEKYLRGRTDKACALRSDTPRVPNAVDESLVRRVAYTAEMKDPFAVLLR